MDKETKMRANNHTSSQANVSIGHSSNTSEDSEEKGVPAENFFAMLDNVILSREFESDQEKSET